MLLDGWQILESVENLFSSFLSFTICSICKRYLPLDSVLYSGEASTSYHNYFPVAWAQLVREAVTESDLDDEIVFFTRSGGTKSPSYSRLFWLGVSHYSIFLTTTSNKKNTKDQLVTWDSFDGLQTVVISMMSSTISGYSLTHSDIGGYTSFDFYNLFGYIRSKELLLRWIELNSFSPVFR